jgi:hypothetical protein
MVQMEYLFLPVITPQSREPFVISWRTQLCDPNLGHQQRKPRFANSNLRSRLIGW